MCACVCIKILQYDLVWYSDDGGVTYAVSVAVLAKMDEAQLVELSDGRVMANMRNNHLSSCDCRAVAISTDGGKTFGNITYDSTLISPVCDIGNSQATYECIYSIVCDLCYCRCAWLPSSVW